MKGLYLILFLFFTITVIASPAPEKAEIKIGIHSNASQHEKINFITFFCQEHDFTLVTSIDSILKTNPLIVRKKDSELVAVDFLVRKILVQNNSEIRVQIYESGKSSMYTIKADSDNHFETKFLSKIDRYIPSNYENELSYFKAIINKENYSIGKAFYDNGDIDSSIIYLNKSVKENKHIDDSYYLLSHCYKSNNNKIKYFDYLKKAINANEEKGAFQIELGNYYLNEGKIPKAIAIYKSQLNSNRYKDLASWNLYVSYNKLKMDSLAFTYLNQIRPGSIYYVNAQELIEIKNKDHTKTKEWNSTAILIFRLFVIGLVLVIVIRLFNKLRHGGTIGEQKFELIILVVGSLVTLALYLLKKII